MTKKSKLMSILTTGVLIVLMLFSNFASTVFAAPLPPANGNLIIHKYLIPDLEQSNSPNDGTAITNPSNIPSTATPLNGVTFDLYKIAIPSSGAVPAQGAYALDLTAPDLSLTDSEGDTYELTVASTASVTTSGTGIANAFGLPQGFYLVVERPSNLVASPVVPFTVAVPMTNPDEDGWLTDVHVYPKNEDISIGKTVNKPTVFVGEEVTWTIRVSVPTFIESFRKFDITDQLDAALDYMSVSAVRGVTVSNSKVNLSNTLYTVTAPSVPPYTLVSFNAAGRTALANYKFVEVDLVTRVNANILIDDGTQYITSNSATIVFNNNIGTNGTPSGDPTGPIDPSNPPSDQEKTADAGTGGEPGDPGGGGGGKPQVHTAVIEILKVDANKTSTTLAGAKFKIASDSTKAQNGNYLRIANNGSILDTTDTGYSTATDWELTSNSSGIIKFEGLKDYTSETGTNAGLGTGTPEGFLSYYLVETKAPDGYNLLASPVMVTFSASNVSISGSTITLTPLSVTVNNSNKFEMPRTGGLGTILFTSGGIALIGIGLMIFFLGKKKRKKRLK